jgi:poly(A) polymerase
MQAAPTKAVMAAITAGGATARFVGGCVRDALIGRPVKDIDIAIDRTPEDNLKALKAAGIGVHETGLRHGTILAVTDKRQFEITTLRVDAETFGRHARVEYTDDWALDAARRDFTMNALFADMDGTLYDPTGGRADLEAGIVRFVGDPAKRIEEDYLRILRFFRFLAWYGRSAVDPAALAACAAGKSGISGLSGERIRQELLRLLAATDPRPSLTLMLQTEVMTEVLPHGADMDALATLMAVDEADPDPLRRLAALLRGSEDGAGLAEWLHLSRAERLRLSLLVSPPAWPSADDGEAGFNALVYRLGSSAVADLALLQGDGALAAKASNTARPEFPLQGRDVLAMGIAAGTDVGELLREVEEWWLARGCAGEKADLLQELSRRAKSLKRPRE